MIKSVIFDFGGVILDLNNKKTLSIPHLLSLLFNIEIEKAVKIWREERDNLITGREKLESFLERLKTKLYDKSETKDLAFHFRQLHEWETDSLDMELLEYIKNLKGKGLKVYILSDALDLGRTLPAFEDVCKQFDGVFTSYSEGFKKPDKEAFLNVLNKTGFKPEECVFIDDTKKNVEAANNLGIRSFVYTDFATLKSNLESVIT